MNNEFEKVFLSNFESAKKAFISEYKKKSKERFQDEIISIDAMKGTFYISSLFQDYPELLIQDRKNDTFLISYSWKEKTYTVVINKNRLNIEEVTELSLKIEDDKRSLELNLVDEHLTYLVFSFLNYLAVKSNKASD